MPTKSRKALLCKTPKPLGSGHFDSDNPDILARRLTTPLPRASKAQKTQIWHLLSDLGSAASIRRAGEIIVHSRSQVELQGALSAVLSDRWFECAPAAAKRLELEVGKLQRRQPSRDSQKTLALLCDVLALAGTFVRAPTLNALLQSRSVLARGAAARYALRLQRADVLEALIPLLLESSSMTFRDMDAVGTFGNAETAAFLWSRALTARKRDNLPLLCQYLRMLAALGAVDILMPLRYWVEEEFTTSEDLGWMLSPSWCALVLARFAGGEATREETVADLRWFLHIAERTAVPQVRLEDNGVFHLATAFAKIGELAEAQRLAERAARRSLPDPERFPELVELIRISAGSGAKPTAWLAWAGDAAAQRKMVETWPAQLRSGVEPAAWNLRKALDPQILRSTFVDALNSTSAVAVRGVLKVLCGVEETRCVQDRIECIASEFPSSVVRWKARRVLNEALNQRASSVQSKAARITRLDAAVLAGAARSTRRSVVPKVPAPKLCLVPPARAGRGWTIEFEGAKPAVRRDTQNAIVKGPLGQTLHRRAPSGPTYEERPEVRDVREPAPPHGPLDEQMIEMAQAVLQNWVYSETALTLDVHGAGQLASFISTPGVSMDEDDLAACGAFIGEALRKRMGGEWSGFDGEYTLNIGPASFDTQALARKLMSQKDAIKGCTEVVEIFERARLLSPPGKKVLAPQDTGGSFERAIRTLSDKPPTVTMSELMSETRIFRYRMDPSDWPIVLGGSDPLLDSPGGARIVAALSIYAPGEVFAISWARWGARRREQSGVLGFLAEAMRTAAERDDLEAMPDWTTQPLTTRMSFLSVLRKKMKTAEWRKVLSLLLRQRANAGDVAGVGWCLFGYKFEFPDALPLLQLFCEMTVSARQTLMRATRHCTHDEVSLFRPIWAEGLRDPAAAVVMAALDSVGINRARSLRPLVNALEKDSREEVAKLAQMVGASFKGR